MANIIATAPGQTKVGTSLSDFISDGGEGDVTLIGLGGNDTYEVTADPNGGLGMVARVIEQAGGGIDKVELDGPDGNINYTLDANVENLILDDHYGSVTLVGNAENNAIDASDNYGSTSLYGYGGNDTIFGGDTGNGYGDYIFGGDGNDTLIGLGGQDRLFGDAGDDTLDGGYGNDVLYGGIGADTLIGGEGDDRLFGEDGNDILFGGARQDGLYGGAGNDNLDGGEGRDYLLGGDGDDILHGGTGEGSYGDRLFGGEGNDVLTGSSSTMFAGEGGDGPEGGDNILSSLYGGAGNDTLNSGTIFYGDYILGDRLFGDDGDDILNGSATGSSVLDGGEGNDQLFGGSNNDYLIGGGGDDFLAAGAGNDVLYGGAGNNVLGGGTGDDIFVLASGSFNAILDGAGNDTVIAYNMDFNLAAAAGNAIESLILRSYGGGFTLTGNDVDNYIQGSYGDDTLIGGIGNDTLDGGEGADTLVGGTGNDNFLVDDAEDVVVELAGEGIDTVFSAVDLVLADNVENAWLMNGNGGYGGSGIPTQLTGNELDNQLIGNKFNNTLIGGAGNDTLDGGEGSDLMIGGAGNDIFNVDDQFDMIVENFNEGTDTVFSSLANTVLGQNLENLTLVEDGGFLFISPTTGEPVSVAIGNNLNNTITGNSFSNFLVGGLGNDTMIGGGGNDIFAVDSLGDVVTEGVNGGAADQVLVNIASGQTYTLSANVENGVLVQTANSSLTGNGLANTLQGNSGNNVLLGNSGNDTLSGGRGSDFLFGGNDNDQLDGGQGNDTMNGGAGNDVFVVDRGDGAGTAIGSGNEDVVVEAAGQGTDTVMSHVYSYTLTNDVENLILAGTYAIKGFGNALGNTITGNSKANTLSGGDGNDTLFGEGGNDTLTGGTGNDTLDGGEGNDVMSGGLANDTYFVNSVSDIVIENLFEGQDTVNSKVSYTLGANIEHLTLLYGGLTGTGNELVNILTGSNGNDVLLGLSGNDTLVGNSGDDILDGGTGVDTMTGGSGNDTFHVDTLTDVVNESLNGGIDTVMINTDVLGSGTRTLSANVENLTMTGAGNLAAVGNALDNTMIGGTGNNTLDARDGNDSLDGGEGNDTLFGGNGNDELYGGIGADILLGEAGNDFLYGGQGNDDLRGGTGDDFFVVNSGDGDAFGGDLLVEDKVRESFNEGIDTIAIVRGAVSTYRVDDDVENLQTWSPNNGGLGGNGGTVNATLNALGNRIDAVFNAASYGGGDTFDGAGGTDTIFGQFNVGEYGGTSSVDLNNIENVNLDLALDYGGINTWAVQTGNVANQQILITGEMFNGGDLALLGTDTVSLDEISATAAIRIEDLDAENDDTGDGAGKLVFNLDGGQAGFTDTLSLELEDVRNILLESDGLEELNLHLSGDVAIGVDGIRDTASGAQQINITGLAGDVGVYGLDSYGAGTVFAQNFVADSLFLDTSDPLEESPFNGSTTLQLDHSKFALNSYGGAGGIGSLTIDTLGDVAENTNGASEIAANGFGAEGITLVGNQGLMITGLNALQFDARGFFGDLNAGFATGGATFYGGSGLNIVNLNNGADTVFFGAEGAPELDALDRITDNTNGDGDTLTSAFYGGGVFTPDVDRIENLNFRVDQDATIDFTNVNSILTLFPTPAITPTGTTTTVNLNGTGDVTVQNVNADDIVINDNIFLGNANLSGGSGNDTLNGNDGNDTLNGGAGSDTLSGGLGADNFVFDNLGSGVDTLDFSGLDGDLLMLSLSIFGGIGAVGAVMNPLSFVSGTAAADSNDHIIYDTVTNPGTGMLFYDPDGNGVESMVQFASLSGAPALASTDIFVIS